MFEKFTQKIIHDWNKNINHKQIHKQKPVICLTFNN